MNGIVFQRLVDYSPRDNLHDCVDIIKFINSFFIIINEFIKTLLEPIITLIDTFVLFKLFLTVFRFVTCDVKLKMLIKGVFINKLVCYTN